MSTFEKIIRTTTAVQWFAMGIVAGMAIATGIFVTSYVLFGP